MVAGESVSDALESESANEGYRLPAVWRLWGCAIHHTRALHCVGQTSLFHRAASCNGTDVLSLSRARTDLCAAMNERMWKVEEISQKYRVSRMTVYRAIQNQSLRAIRFGRNFRVPDSALIEYLENSIENYPNHRPEGMEEE